MSVVAAPSFGILPLVVDGLVAGCLYFDNSSAAFALDAAKRQAVAELRNCAVTAISRKRKG